MAQQGSGQPEVRWAGQQWAGYLEEGNPIKLIGAFTASMRDPENHYSFPESVRRTIWQDVAQTADEYNRPGRFTTFSGYYGIPCP